jgi:PHS family inorganic phosphate transporter-like MFS transporter
VSDHAASAPEGLLDTLDDSRISRFQWKIMFVSGMGFFTDAYDLFVIGIVVALLKTEWGLSTSQVSLLNSATLAASAVGAIVFGRVADILGRKRIYGYEVLILAIGALASAFAPNYTFLLVCRVILGVGIGGDYPVSATIMSEYSGKQTRGRMVGLVFAMQGAGLVIGPLVASGLLASGLSNDTTWRILLALGAIPGLAVFYLRRQIHETPRFAIAGGAAEEAEAAVAAATGAKQARGPAGESRAKRPQGTLEGFLILARSRRMLLWLLGTAGAWALLDFCYYGNSISTPEILNLLNPAASLLHNTLIQLAIFAVFALPGYAVAILLMDKTGRKSIQVLGFAIMALMFGLIA